ncbi:Protein Wnt-11 [Echinococcus granulosus]|nr:Protein Wnt-11 [Echinococcus granulosus]
MVWTIKLPFGGSLQLLLTILLTTGWLFPNGTGAIQWLGIYHLRKSSDYPRDSSAPAFTTRECEIARYHLGFRPRQARFCNHPRLGFAMLPVLRAARAVGFHCPDTFSNRRWNCSSVEALPRMSPELKRGTREQAIVHAYAAAALIFEIGRYCALNKIRYCSCGMTGGTEMIISPEGGQMSRFPQGYVPSPRVRRQLDMANFRKFSDAISFQPEVSHSQHQKQFQQMQTQVQNTHYWSGCPDNVDTARSYVAQFLGFDEKRLLMVGYHPRSHSVTPYTTSSSASSSSSASVGSGSSVYSTPFKNPLQNAEDSAPYGFYMPPSTNLPQPYLKRKTRSAESAKADTKSLHRSSRRTGRRRRQPSKMKLTNQHNYMAGAWMMIALQKQSCKCHGVSGSCTQKVCFRQLQRIDTEPIKAALRQRYLTAKMVSGIADGNLMASVFKETDFVDEYVHLEDLVFTQHSPDYCDPDPQRGSLGTHGRQCNLNTTGDGSCMNMCCGRGHKSTTHQIYEKCNCIMQPNFKVHCQTCIRNEQKSFTHTHKSFLLPLRSAHTRPAVCKYFLLRLSHPIRLPV